MEQSTRQGFDWYYKRVRGENAHLSCWLCKFRGLELQVRYMQGADYNEGGGRKNDDGTTDFLFNTHISFPNHSTEWMKFVKGGPVNHSIGQERYRPNIDVVKKELEDEVIDLVRAITREWEV